MATIDLNNLIRPKKVNSTSTIVTEQVETNAPVYVDLHLDFALNKSIGLGENPVNSLDIKTDYDIEAIKNSIKNIFTTKKGQKLLDPNFGCSLDQFLFEKVSELGGKAIGDEIFNAISQYEPRVDVIKIYVKTQPYVTQNLNIINNNLTTSIKKKVENQVEEIGPGYAITVIYQIKEIKKQDILNMVAQIGGQILF